MVGTCPLAATRIRPSLDDLGTKSKWCSGPHRVYGFLATSPNAVVEPIHPKAMPVILTADEEAGHLDARDEAKSLQRPLPDGRAQDRHASGPQADEIVEHKAFSLTWQVVIR